MEKAYMLLFFTPYNVLAGLKKIKSPSTSEQFYVQWFSYFQSWIEEIQSLKPFETV